MAWYALYKWFIQFRKISYTNWISWYKGHLYEEWFNGLSEDGQKAELERQQRIKDKRKHDGEMAFKKLGIMFNVMNEVTHGRMHDYVEAARLVDKISVHQSKYW